VTVNIPTLDAVPPEAYTAGRLNADLEALCAEYPTNRNPTDAAARVCLYRSSEGWCLIGAWLHARGHGLDPEYEGKSASTVIDGLGYDPEVGQMASSWQMAGDGAEDWNVAPKRWADVLASRESWLPRWLLNDEEDAVRFKLVDR
jgi:hypothetical protein